MIKKIWLYVTGILGALVLFLGLQAKRYKKKVGREKRRADRAESVNTLHRKINQNEKALTGKQRERQKQDDENLKAGHRDQLDNDW